MYDVAVNYWAVLVAAVAAMVVGYLWYGPLFAKTWMRLNGYTEADLAKGKSSMGMSYLWQYVAAAVMAYVLAHFLQFMQITDFAGVWTTVLWVWLGFIVAGGAGHYLWPIKSFGAFALDMVERLITLLVMGWVLLMFM